MRYKGQLDLIRFLLYPLIVSPLLACDRWNRGMASWELGSPGEMYRRRQSRQWGSRQGSASARARRSWDSWRRGDGNSCPDILTTLSAFLFVWGQQTVIKQWEKWLFLTFCLLNSHCANTDKVSVTGNGKTPDGGSCGSLNFLLRTMFLSTSVWFVL